jgi:hypothetical protein
MTGPYKYRAMNDASRVVREIFGPPLGPPPGDSMLEFNKRISDELLSKAITDLQNRTSREVLGAVTEMKCSCGGALQTVHRIVVPPDPPRPTHRKRRILKKLMKQWDRHRHILQGVCIGLSQHPSFRCVVCSKQQGFYQAMGRNLFHIQPLPIVAFPDEDSGPVPE